MRFNIIDICQNAWYKCHGIKSRNRGEFKQISPSYTFNQWRWNNENLYDYYYLMYPMVFSEKMENQEIKHIGFPHISQSSFSKVMRKYFLDVQISKENSFARCNECITIQDRIKGTTDIAKVEMLQRFEEGHN